MNFKEDFKECVMDYFVREYRCGRTPNPCIACNRYIKWEALLHKARSIGADYLATGHYARIKHLPNGRYAVINSVTAAKDQTYALYNLTQEQLAHTLMPVGAYDKEQIRAFAREQELPVAQKPDSQDICFIDNHDYAGFVTHYGGADAVPGNFVSSDGTVLGTHKGITHYTIGQRKGLGISFGKPMYVTAICPKTNEVVLGEEDALWVDTLTATQVNCMGVDRFAEGMRMCAKIRYSHKGEMCTVTALGEDSITLTFDQPVRAVTPGQAVVCYDGDIVLGGAVIAGAF
jgi:tRNA-specific 2-thiouridylase